MVSLLALTAFHDSMKMENLLPTVQPQHDGYHGYAAGNVIGDHDHALCYIMDHYPDLLPSFKELSASERQSVQFTQRRIILPGSRRLVPDPSALAQEVVSADLLDRVLLKEAGDSAQAEEVQAAKEIAARLASEAAAAAKASEDEGSCLEDWNQRQMHLDFIFVNLQKRARRQRLADFV
ncbi:par-5 [Symbiodinium natans]|uniref:Par-5 protein n=1 Tax=Symbiodinium natans TaxID=878477 RepID=A0A812K8H5_9DINO|nr:par-5 [Symbiodinium natans]